MRLFIFILALSLISCGQNSSKNKKKISTLDTVNTLKDNSESNSIVKEDPKFYIAPDEEKVNSMLNGHPGNGWHVLNDNEAKWMKDAFDYFIIPKRKEEPNYPYITKGDFNADGNPDFAAVVTDSLKNKFQVAILLGTDNIIFWDEDIMTDAAISSIPKSTLTGMDGEKIKKVKMTGDGINVEYFEKASFVLYWEKGSFKRLQTGD